MQTALPQILLPLPEYSRILVSLSFHVFISRLVKILHGNIICALRLIRLLRLVVRVRSRALDDLLDSLFHEIPIFGLDFEHSDVEVLRDIHELFPALLVIDKGDGDTNATKSPSAADTMQIGLWVWLTTAVIGHVLETCQHPGRRGLLGAVFT